MFNTLTYATTKKFLDLLAIILPGYLPHSDYYWSKFYQLEVGEQKTVIEGDFRIIEFSKIPYDDCDTQIPTINADTLIYLLSGNQPKILDMPNKEVKCDFLTHDCLASQFLFTITESGLIIENLEKCVAELTVRIKVFYNL